MLVSPFNTIVDKAVIENSSGKTPLWRGVRKGLKSLFTRPQTFMSSFEFKWVFFVYASTYISSNVADHVHMKGVDDSLLKLLITFTVNTSASLVKDKALTQRFGSSGSNKKRNFPMASLGLFFMRDIIAMASAFTIPALLGEYIHKRSSIDEKNSLRIAQLTSPLLVQVVATPLHLVGIDLYVNEKSNWKQRMAQLGKTYCSTLTLRMLRFLPAYGLGGIANMELRTYFRGEKDLKM